MSDAGSMVRGGTAEDASTKSLDVEAPTSAPQPGSTTDLADEHDLEDSAEKHSPEKVTLRIAEDETHMEPPPYHADMPPPYRPAAFKKSLKDAQAQSSGKVDFAKRVVFGICCGTICCGLVIALNLAIPIAMIVMGGLHLKACPRQRYIPIYLLVGGCFGVVRAVVSIVEQVLKRLRARRNRDSSKPQPPPKPNPADGIVSCFLMAWFITGCYWIYSMHGDYQSEIPGLPDYCNEVVYLFAFWLTTATFILMGLGLLLCCVMCIGMCVVAKSAS